VNYWKYNAGKSTFSGAGNYLRNLFRDWELGKQRASHNESLTLAEKF